MKNKVSIKIVLITTMVLSSIFGIVQAQEPSGKAKSQGLTIRSNSRDIQPRRRDNLHQRMVLQKHSLNKPMSHVAKDQSVIRPNKKAIMQRKGGIRKLNNGSLRRIRH